jgi:hypothetical protein
LSICNTKTKSKANPTTSPTKNQSTPIPTPYLYNPLYRIGMILTAIAHLGQGEVC